MAEPKTKPTTASAIDFLNTIEPEQKRQDSLAILEMMQKITGKKPVMWGEAIIGFDMYHYKSEKSSQEGDWPLAAFAPRKQSLIIYLMPDFGETDKAVLKKLGKHKISGKVCLSINKLADVDMKVLAELIGLNYQRALKELANA